MSLLLLYYLFLIAGAVLVAALRDTTLTTQRRNLYLGYLLAPPLVLILNSLNVGFVLGSVLVLLIAVSGERLLRRFADQPTSSATLRWWLGIWLIEAVLPLALHSTLKSRQDLERWSMIVSGIVLFAGSLLVFLVLAPDRRKQA